MMMDFCLIHEYRLNSSCWREVLALTVSSGVGVKLEPEVCEMPRHGMIDYRGAASVAPHNSHVLKVVH